jgi:tetratricopeptide (TPR) repeat protein/class 3 adenylate cyclase
MKIGPSGAEELSRILKEVFEPLVHSVYARGGFIPYFAGDAFTAIFQDTDHMEVDAFIQAALSVQHFFEKRAFKFGKFSIGIKIGLSCGNVEWGIVGQQHRAYYFRGNPIDGSAYGQDFAKNKPFTIALDEALQQRITTEVVVHPSDDPKYFFIDPGVAPRAFEEPPMELPELHQDVVELFLPQSIIDYNQVGEFRTVISVFVAFEGVDNHALLNKFASVVLEQIQNFSGYFKEIDFGDKGGLLTCFFGAPVSFENNTDRALEFIYTLNQELYELRAQFGFQFKAGASMGTAFTGLIGGVERAQYAAVGNRVNLAARLMAKADWEEVLTDGEISKNRHFNFSSRGEVEYKGIQGSVPTYNFLGRSEFTATVYQGEMVGRDTEMNQMIDFAKPMFDGRPVGVAIVYGEAGIGKSRFSHELRKALTYDQKVQWHTCPADQILRKPFNPFVYFLKNYFDQSADNSASRNLQRFEARFQQLFDKLESLQGSNANIQGLRDELLRTKSVLGAQVGITYHDSLWEQLDARGRYQNSIQAIIDLFKAESIIRPLAIELEDAHWLDENSQELLFELLKNMRRHPILLFITSRFGDDGNRPTLFSAQQIEGLQIPILETDLNLLHSEAVKEFSENKLQGKITAPFLEMLLRTTNSNPFFLEQLLEYFSEQQMLKYENGFWNIKDGNIQLSSSINVILTARIDRLSSLVKETVKAAAVIGREFEIPILTEIMSAQEEFIKQNHGQGGTLLAEQIDVAEKVQIWRAMNELRYIFRHSLLREAAYGMQLHTRLQQLHRLIGESMERIYADKIEERYVDLAFHFEKADAPEKTIEYLRKAGDYARRNFQNQQALEFYEKLLARLGSQQDTNKQVRTLLKKGRILELIGKWEDCKNTYTQALTVAKQNRDVLLIGRSLNSVGRVLMLKGDYFEAMQFLQKGIQLFESIEDQYGIAEVHANLGHLYFRQGKYVEAKKYFQSSISTGQSVRGYVIDAQTVANLGLTFMNQGNYEEGIRQQQEHLAYCQQHNDKQGMATMQTYIGIVFLEKGDYDEALESFQKGYELANELGNKQLTAIAIGNLGLVYERKGNYTQAMQHYVDDLELCKELGDKQGTSITLGMIGQLLNIEGEFHQAIEYMQKALMICEELGYQKGIGRSVNTLGDIFYNLKQYDRSIHFYNRAIEVSRSIGAKLVLGFSLVEKGTVLLETSDWEALRLADEEAAVIAKELGNPDLVFEAELLRAKSQIAQQQEAEATQLLKKLLKRRLNADQEAPVYFELYRANPENLEYAHKAKTLYEQLYKSTPRFSYKTRMDQITLQ